MTGLLGLKNILRRFLIRVEIYFSLTKPISLLLDIIIKVLQSLISYLRRLKIRLGSVIILSSEGRPGSGINLLERSIKDGIGRLRARLV